jgi:protoporphyrinogen oxidase
LILLKVTDLAAFMTSPATATLKTVLIVGAGPAGLTSGAELVEHGFEVQILEKDPEFVGGISRTARYKGYRFDIGGHRFFSKSPEITKWWRQRLPHDFIQVRRMSRIFYGGKFYDYPLRAMNALGNLGIWTSGLCMLSYLLARLSPIRPEKSFADWVTNRFGSKLFTIFFKTYTEKVWGMPCHEISADWAAQRIKGLSLLKAVWHALLPADKKGASAKGSIKTLIDRFEYPRLGPGMMWEKTRDDLLKAGAGIHMGLTAAKIKRAGSRITAIVSEDTAGNQQEWPAEAFILSMPLQETVLKMDPPLADSALAAAKRLRYRDFLTVALMVRQTNLFPDNWIYVHDPGVRLGRIQNFNNWSPEMVPATDTTCLGLEYFCFEGDGLWTLSDPELIELGKKELAQLGLVKPESVFDGCVVRMPKSYPVYGPGYQEDLDAIRMELEKLENCQVVGRNGLHKYNNQDHSMMTALLAARNLSGAAYNVWKVNTDAEYHEEADERNDTSGRLTPQPVDS